MDCWVRELEKQTQMTQTRRPIHTSLFSLMFCVCVVPKSLCIRVFVHRNQSTAYCKMRASTTKLQHTFCICIPFCARPHTHAHTHTRCTFTHRQNNIISSNPFTLQQILSHLLWSRNRHDGITASIAIQLTLNFPHTFRSHHWTQLIGQHPIITLFACYLPNRNEKRRRGSYSSCTLKWHQRNLV